MPQDTDATHILAADHRSVEALFEEFEKASGADRKAKIAEQICTELKILAGDKRLTAIETDGAKLKLFRNKEPILIDNKFPRLTKKEPKAKLNEIKKLLLAL